MFKFRKITTFDFPLMLEWLSKEYIKKWWDDGDDTLEKVAAHYGETSGDTARFILIEERDGTEKPIGYFQYYFIADGSIGIDQFIGEEENLNKAIGEKSIKIFIDLILVENNPSFIILDPSPDNKRAVRCYEKVGFKHYETRKTGDGQTAYMMRFEINRRSI